MDLYPAIDLRDGRCVRLHRGDYDREIIYDADPVEQAQLYAGSGADWIHVVDLDAARTGDAANREMVTCIAESVDVPVQTGGGVRSYETAASLFDAGVTRVVVGTAAFSDPELVGRIARRHRVAVGLDSLDGEVRTDGWTRGSGTSTLDAARRFSDVGVEAFVVTDIGRDGTLSGPDLDGLTELVAATDVDVIASGGVADLDDLRRLTVLRVDGRGLAGVIVGKALYEGRFGVADAIDVIGERS